MKKRAFINELKKDVSFYNKNTEILAIWIALYACIALLFFLAVQSNLLTAILILCFSLMITILLTFLTALYLSKAAYGSKKQLLPKVHKALNKKFLVVFPQIVARGQKNKIFDNKFPIRV